jgi:hypothetical protein
VPLASAAVNRAGSGAFEAGEVVSRGAGCARISSFASGALCQLCVETGGNGFV